VNDLVAVGDPTDYVIAGASLDDDSAFIADARTRVPLLAANVLALKTEVDRLRAENARHAPIVEAVRLYMDSDGSLGGIIDAYVSHGVGDSLTGNVL
jgi:hypothetical protein